MKSIKKKDPSEIVDTILDNLSKRKKLSKSEKKFMDAVSKKEVVDASVPDTGNDFWDDASNPHNLGTMWVGENGVWKIIKSIKEEEMDYMRKHGDSDDIYELEEKTTQEEITDELP